jgi:hypothetical protein
VLCAPLRVAPSPGPGLGGGAAAACRPWLLLVDGALPAIAAAIRGTSDEHFRFHAHSTLAACLERLRSLQQQAEGGGEAPGPGPAAAGRAAAGGVAPPALDAAAQRLVLRLLWQGFEVRPPALRCGRRRTSCSPVFHRCAAAPTPPSHMCCRPPPRPPIARSPS